MNTSRSFVPSNQSLQPMGTLFVSAAELGRYDASERRHELTTIGQSPLEMKWRSFRSEPNHRRALE